MFDMANVDKETAQGICPQRYMRNCVPGKRHQEQGQEITAHSICGMQLLAHTSCFSYKRVLSSQYENGHLHVV